MNFTIRILLGLIVTALVVALLLIYVENPHAKVAAVAVTLVGVGTLAAVATYRRLER